MTAVDPRVAGDLAAARLQVGALVDDIRKAEQTILGWKLAFYVAVSGWILTMILALGLLVAKL